MFSARRPSGDAVCVGLFNYNRFRLYVRMKTAVIAIKASEISVA